MKAEVFQWPHCGEAQGFSSAGKQPAVNCCILTYWFNGKSQSSEKARIKTHLLVIEEFRLHGDEPFSRSWLVNI